MCVSDDPRGKKITSQAAGFQGKAETLKCWDEITRPLSTDYGTLQKTEMLTRGVSPVEY